MLTFSHEPTEIIEIPVIVVNDVVQLIAPEMAVLTESTLRDIATAMGGNFVYLKVRATYTAVEIQMCTHKNCFRPAKPTALTCGDH